MRLVVDDFDAARAELLSRGVVFEDYDHGPDFRTVDGVCQGCHQRLSPLELDRLKRSPGLRRCEYCRRILIFR